MGHRERQLATVLSSHRTSRHVAAPSLSHYASLSFIVRGRGQISEVGSQRSEDRDSLVGAAFSRDLIDLDNTMDSNRNQRLLLHDLYQLTAFL